MTMAADARGDGLPRNCTTADGTPKTSFDSHVTAMRVARNKGRRSELSAYRCPSCGAWHLSHARRG